MNTVLKIKQYWQNHGLLGLLRKVVYWIQQKIDIGLHFYRRCSFYIRTQCWIHTVGTGTSVKGIGNHIEFGKGVTLYDNVVIELNESALLKVGNHFTLSYGGIISCRYDIFIGNDVMIGEYSSIRDSTHDYTVKGIPFKRQKDIFGSVKIGNNIWIGRGCMIFPGTIIDDGVIIGANSIVKGHLKSNGIYAGAPCKLIKQIDL